MEREWRVIPGFPWYAVSNDGLIRREAAEPPTRRIGKLIKTRAGTNGYPMAILFSGKKITEGKSVHSLVAAAFLGPRPDGMHVNHKNGVRSDNRVENLEYVTPTENVRHSRDVTKTLPRGERRHNAKLNAFQARVILRAVGLSGIVKSELARMFGVTPCTIQNIRRGCSWNWVQKEGGAPSLSAC